MEEVGKMVKKPLFKTTCRSQQLSVVVRVTRARARAECRYELASHNYVSVVLFCYDLIAKTFQRDNFGSVWSFLMIQTAFERKF